GRWSHSCAGGLVTVCWRRCRRIMLDVGCATRARQSRNVQLDDYVLLRGDRGCLAGEVDACELREGKLSQSQVDSGGRGQRIPYPVELWPWELAYVAAQAIQALAGHFLEELGHPEGGLDRVIAIANTA